MMFSARIGSRKAYVKVLPVFYLCAACSFGLAIASGVAAQSTCSASCPDGSMSEVYDCSSGYVPMCYRPRAPADTPQSPGPPRPTEEQRRSDSETASRIREFNATLGGHPSDSAEASTIRRLSGTLDSIGVPSPTIDQRLIREANPPTRPSLTASDIARLNPRVQGIRAALVRVNNSMQLGDSQRVEMLDESEHAAADLVIICTGGILDVIGLHLDSQTDTASKELSRAINTLTSETDPDHRLQFAIRALQSRRDGLRSLSTSVEAYGQAWNSAALAAEVAESETRLSPHNVLEAIWTAGENLKVIPPGLSTLKSALDAGYDFAVLYGNAKLSGDLNNNSERNLVALKEMKHAMEAAVAAQHP